MGKLRMLQPTLTSLARTVRYLEPKADAELSRDRDRREPWRRWYKTARWQRLRWAALERDAFTCAYCGKMEDDTSQLVGDHRVPVRGIADRMWDLENVQTLCKPCHDRVKQIEEARDRR